MVEVDPNRVLRACSLGTQGVGELGIVGAAAAVAYAVCHATGRRIRDLLIAPDKLLESRPAAWEPFTAPGIHSRRNHGGTVDEYERPVR